MNFNDIENPAYFLDFDGTLVNFADDPEGVYVADELRQALTGLEQITNGAIALISGRSISSLSNLIQLPLSMAGSHGAEWRVGDGDIESVSLESDAFQGIKTSLLSFAEVHGLIVEDKGHAVALHYRVKPELKAVLDDYIDSDLMLGQRTDVRVIRGNCVREIQPKGVDKGVAIARFMGMPPFEGRVPVYVGDDTTDEDGFAWVNDHDGISVKVGTGDSCAKYRLSDPGEVFAFLRGQLDKLRQLNDRTQSRTGSDR